MGDIVYGKKSNHYLSNGQLIGQFVKSAEAGSCTPELLKMFQMIAERLAGSIVDYISFHDRASCINYGVSEAWRKWDTFNMDKSDNIFSFYTVMIRNDMVNHYKYLTRGKALNISIEALFTSADL